MRIPDPSSTTRRRSKLIAATAFCSALLAAGSVAALPPNGEGIPPDPPVPVYEFSALWNEGLAATSVGKFDDLADLEAAMVTQAASGWKLDAFESWTQGSDRLYAGLFHQAAGSRYLSTGLTETQFAYARGIHMGWGHHLIDVEVRFEDGARRYSGLWTSVAAGTESVVQMTASLFEDEWQSRKATEHLVVFDTWWENDEVKIYAVFGTGAEPAGSRIAIDLSWEGFEEAMDNNYQEADVRLFDFEAASGKGDHFSGRWKPLLWVRDWLGVNFSCDLTLASNLLFNYGYTFSAVTMPDDLPLPTDDRMDMLDLEVYYFLINGPIVHGKPLHDGGTPGPPCRPSC